MEPWNDQIQKDQLKNGILISKQIKFSSIWPTIAKLPVIHPYTNYEPPFTLVALACKPDFYVHVQTLPEFNKNQLQLIRVHPFTHPQGMQEHETHNLAVSADIENFYTDKAIFKLHYTLSGHVHLGQYQDKILGETIEKLVASPSDGVITLDFKKPQRFIAHYKTENSSLKVLHIVIPEEYLDFLQERIRYCQHLECNVIDYFFDRTANKQIEESLRRRIEDIGHIMCETEKEKKDNQYEHDNILNHIESLHKMSVTAEWLIDWMKESFETFKKTM